jgi:hypothetical protein
MAVVLVVLNATSWFARGTMEPSKPSAIAEQVGHPAWRSRPNMK